MADVPLYVVSDYTSSERRITPAWSISQLKAKLEPITGIPPSCQQIFLKTSAAEKIAVEAQDEESVYLQQFPLAPYAELLVRDSIFWAPPSGTGSLAFAAFDSDSMWNRLGLLETLGC